VTTALHPVPDPYTQFFWDGCREHKLLISRCDQCGFFMHFPRESCKKCHSFSLSPQQVSGLGTLYTFTICRQAFHPWFEDRLPYVLAVVELPEQPGLKLVTNIIGCPIESVKVGMELEVAFTEIDDTLTLPLFRPRSAA
jgi:uncharacterized protein